MTSVLAALCIATQCLYTIDHVEQWYDKEVEIERLSDKMYLHMIRLMKEHDRSRIEIPQEEKNAEQTN